MSKNDRLIFNVMVDGFRGRVVLNPTAAEAEDQLVIETHGLDASGADCWTPIYYRDSKRFVTAALLYAAVFGAQPGQPVEVGEVARSKLQIAPPPAFRALLSMGVEVADPSRQLKDGSEP